MGSEGTLSCRDSPEPRGGAGAGPAPWPDARLAALGAAPARAHVRGCRRSPARCPRRGASRGCLGAASRTPGGRLAPPGAAAVRVPGAALPLRTAAAAALGGGGSPIPPFSSPAEHCHRRLRGCMPRSLRCPRRHFVSRARPAGGPSFPLRPGTAPSPPAKVSREPEPQRATSGAVPGPVPPARRGVRLKGPCSMPAVGTWLNAESQSPSGLRQCPAGAVISSPLCVQPCELFKC